MACVFCQIIAGELPGDFLYQDEEVVALRDINPLAPTHILVIPREHIASLAELTEAQSPLVGRMVGVANQMARKEGVDEGGYRVIINSGREGGQAVPHLHLHLLGGRQLSSRMG